MIPHGPCTVEEIELLKLLHEQHRKKIAERFGTPEGGERTTYTNMLPDISVDAPSSLDAELKEKTRTFIQRLLNSVYGEHRRVLSVGFIHAVSGNKPQPWHFDYSCKTENIFVPMVRLSDLNGTEYVQFEEPAAAEYWMWYLYATRDECYDLPPLFPDDDPRHQIPNAPSKAYTTKAWNSEPYMITRLPFYLFHRGPTNRTDETKVLFYVATTDDPTFDMEKHQKSPIITGDEDLGSDQIPGSEAYLRKKQILDAYLKETHAVSS